VEDYLDRRFAGWKGSGPDPLGLNQALFGPGVLRSFIEAFSVLAHTLKSHCGEIYDLDGERDSEDRQRLVGECMSAARIMLSEDRIRCATVISVSLFESAARLAGYRGLLDGPGETLLQGRNLFAAEVDQVMTALNRLQDSYESFSSQVANKV
jgi:glycerol-3-phosphate O-acyltransferase